MPLWFIILAGLAAVGAVAAQSGDLVLLTTILSFGLMTPVWYVAANLWWVVVVAAPSVWAIPRGRWIIGPAISLALLVVPLVWLQGQIEADRAAVLTDVGEPPAGLARAKGGPRSLEIVAPDQSQFATGGPDCDRLCEGLLEGGDIAWLRVSRISGVTGETLLPLIYYRADAAECLALDPDFPAGGHCILARADDGQSADLRLVPEETGDGYGKLEPTLRLVNLTGKQSLALYDAGHRILAQAQRLFWIEAELGPLTPGMTGLATGRRNDGIFLPRHRASGPELDPAAVLQRAGLTLAPPRAVLPSSDGRSFGKPAEEARPWDVALLHSIIKVSPRPLGQSRTAMFDRLMTRLVKLDASTPSEQALLRVLALDPTIAPSGMGRLLYDHPDWFITDRGLLYDRVIHGTEAEAQDAAMKLLTIVRGQKPGTFAADADLYRAAFASGRQDRALVQLAGFYGFDPAPILMDWLARRPDMGPLVISAICRSAPLYPGSLGPVVRDIMLGQVEHVLGFGGQLQDGAHVLARLGRLDLLAEVEGQLDWTALAETTRKRVTPHDMTDAQVRDYILGSRDPGRLVNRQCP